MDEAEVVGAVCEVRQQAAHPGTGLAALAKFIEALHQSAGLAEKAKVLAFPLQRLPVHALQLRLVIERIQMAYTADAEHLDHAFGLGREVRLAG